MDQRPESKKEVVLDVLEAPVTTFDALVERCHRALSAELWVTCCWSDDESDWKIGDFNYLVVSVSPDPDSSLYVQFWSEPQEPVLTEVCSGEWCPGAIRYIGPEQRRALEQRGYAINGQAHNFSKQIVVGSPTAAEDAAMDMLHIFFDVFGYRGQWPLELERHRGERAEHDPVYTSVTPEDFVKIATAAGFAATSADEDDSRVILKRGRRTFTAALEWRVPNQNVYALITLQADLTARVKATDEAIDHMNVALRLAKVARGKGHTVHLKMPLVLDGGVTAAWLAKSLNHWLSSWRECERWLRRGGAAAGRQRGTRTTAAVVH